MTKKAVILKIDDKPIWVAQITDVGIMGFLDMKREAEANLNEMLMGIETVKSQIRALNAEIESLKKEVSFLKGDR